MARDIRTAEPFLTPTEVTEVIPVSVSTLANWRSAGKGPRFVKVGGRVGYRLSDVESWLSSATAGTPTGSRIAS